MGIRSSKNKFVIILFFAFCTNSAFSQINANLQLGLQGNFGDNIPNQAKHGIIVSAVINYDTKSFLSPFCGISYLTIPFNKSINIQGYSTEAVLNNQVIDFVIGLSSNLKNAFLVRNELTISYGLGLALFSDPTLRFYGGNYEVYSSKLTTTDLNGMSNIYPISLIALNRKFRIKSLNFTGSLGSLLFLKREPIDAEIYISNNVSQKTEHIHAKVSFFRYFISFGIQI